MPFDDTSRQVWPGISLGVYGCVKLVLRCRQDERYLGIEIGRDYADVPPIRGS
jgi:hypothetical protein